MDTRKAQNGNPGARPEPQAPETRAHKVKEKAIDEGKKFLGIFLYLFVVFALFNLHEYIVLAQHGIDFAHYGFAAINALVMGKVILICEDLHLGERFDDRPLVYPILLSSLLFGIVLIAFHLIEQVIIGLWHGQTLAASIPTFGGGGVTGAIMVGIIISVSLIPLFALRSIQHVIGASELHMLLFVRGRKEVIVEVRERPRSGGMGGVSSA